MEGRRLWKILVLGEKPVFGSMGSAIGELSCFMFVTLHGAGRGLIETHNLA